MFLRKDLNLSVPSIRGFQSVLSAVFKFVLPDIQDSLSFETFSVLLSWSALLLQLVLRVGTCCGSSLFSVFEPLSVC